MTGLLEELRLKWRQAQSSSPGGREWRGVALAVTGPVRFLAGARDQDNRVALLIEVPLQIAPRRRLRMHCEGISVADTRSELEGVMRVGIALERADLQEVFEILALDLVAVGSTGPSAVAAVTSIAERLEAWQACLRNRHRGLTREEQVGLLGELLILAFASEEIGFPTSVEAWCGPRDGLHDFEKRGVAIEVKTTLGPSTQIRISRLDQLSQAGLSDLLLARVRLQESQNGFTLPEKVGEIRAELVEKHPQSVSLFDEKMLYAGYLEADATVYGLTRIVPQDVAWFLVLDDFPRLTRANVPIAVVDAVYVLEERHLASHALNEQKVRRVVRQMSMAE